MKKGVLLSAVILIGAFCILSAGCTGNSDEDRRKAMAEYAAEVNESAEY